MKSPHPHHFCISLLFASVILVGCKDKDAVKVYQVSKAEPEAPSAQASAAGDSGMGALPPNHPAVGSPGDAMAPAGQPSEIQGTPPPNWEAQPLATMRLASYLVKGDGGATADISIVALGGAAGGVLDNVNRWLSQLGKPAITEEQLAQIAQKVTSPLGEVTVVDLEGSPEGADASKDGRIIAGISSGDGRSFFFKMRGNAALAESQKAGFIQWISSVRLAEAAGSAASAPAGPAVKGHPPLTLPDSGAAAAPDAGSEKHQIIFETPADWKPGAPAAMRYASFTAAGPNGESADISVSVFGGEAGGDLGNVNRWRGQIGLGDIGADGLKSLIVPVKGKDSEILTVDMAGPKSRVLAGWARSGGNTWFFKLTAPEQLAASQKESFVKFLESVQLRP